MSQSRTQQDVYSREYGRSDSQLSFRGSDKPDIYSREYVRGRGSGKQALVHVSYMQKADIPTMQSRPKESMVQKKEATTHTEPQPSIFDKISRFLHGALGEK
jgi:hypothetical protein